MSAINDTNQITDYGDKWLTNLIKTTTETENKLKTEHNCDRHIISEE